MASGSDVAKRKGWGTHGECLIRRRTHPPAGQRVHVVDASPELKVPTGHEGQEVLPSALAVMETPVSLLYVPGTHGRQF